MRWPVASMGPVSAPPALGGDPRGREPRVPTPPVAELLPAVVRHEGLEHSRMGTFRVVVEEHQHAAYGRSPWRGPAGLGRWVRVVAVPPNVTRQRGLRTGWTSAMGKG